MFLGVRQSPNICIFIISRHIRFLHRNLLFSNRRSRFSNRKLWFDFCVYHKNLFPSTLSHIMFTNMILPATRLKMSYELMVVVYQSRRKNRQVMGNVAKRPVSVCWYRQYRWCKAKGVSPLGIDPRRMAPPLTLLSYDRPHPISLQPMCLTSTAGFLFLFFYLNYFEKLKLLQPWWCQMIYHRTFTFTDGKYCWKLLPAKFRREWRKFNKQNKRLWVFSLCVQVFVKQLEIAGTWRFLWVCAGL